jgi:hypothetical protein
VDLVRDRVRSEAGVDLVPEIVFLGVWDGWPWPGSLPAAEPAEKERA